MALAAEAGRDGSERAAEILGQGGPGRAVRDRALGENPDLGATLDDGADLALEPGIVAGGEGAGGGGATAAGAAAKGAGGGGSGGGVGVLHTRIVPRPGSRRNNARNAPNVVILTSNRRPRAPRWHQSCRRQCHRELCVRSHSNLLRSGPGRGTM